MIYTLYNFYDSKQPNNDTPSTFLEKVKYILNLGCVAYPMRYESITSLKKNHFISDSWAADQLEAFADARRVIGYVGLIFTSSYFFRFMD